MFPFYTNVIVHFIFIAFMLFLLPESLSSEARAILSKNAQLSREAAIRRDTAEREWENETPTVEISDPLLSGPNMGCRVSTAGPSKSRKRAFGNAMRLGRRTFKFLEPLAIFLPRERDDGVGKDWTMCLMGCTMVSLSMMMVSTFRILYGRKLTRYRVSCRRRHNLHSSLMGGPPLRSVPLPYGCRSWLMSCSSGPTCL